MIEQFRQIKQASDRTAGPLLLAGLAGVTLHNWRLWQRDHPLAMRLRDDQPPLPVLARTPRISVLVAAWNEAARIDAHLESFGALAYPDIELIICAGGTDDTLARAQRHARANLVVLEQQPGEGKQRALARCYEHASGEIMYFTDADCIYDHAALIRLLAPIVNDGEQAATGGSRPLDEQCDRVLPQYLWAADQVAAVQQGRYSHGLLGRNAAVARRALDQISGLDFVARTGTDYQLARRLIDQDMAIRYVRDSVVASEYPATLRVYRHKQARWLRNLLIHGRRYGARSDVQVTARTVATGLIMLALPLLSLIGGRSVLALWTLLLGHATASKLRYALFAARVQRRPLAWRQRLALAPLTLIDFAIWASPLLDLIDPKRREQW